MMFSYSTLLISIEDYKRASRPKKALFLFASLWTGLGIGIWAVKQMNPEIFYKKIVLSPLVVFSMTLSPLLAITLYRAKQT